MIFLLYIIIFLTVLYIRARHLSGKNMFSRSTDKGVRYLETRDFDDKGRTITAQLGVELGCQRYFSITPERWYHRWLKNLNLATEVETGNDALDQKLFIVSDHPEQMQAMIQTKGFVDALHALFIDKGVKSLRAFNNKLWVKTKSMPTSSYTDVLVNKYLDTITTIAAVAIDNSAGALDDFKPLFGKPQISILFMLCHAAVFFVGIFAIVPLFFESYEIVNTTSLIMRGAATAVAIGGVWLLLILSLLRGSGWIALVLADFVIMGIVGVALSATFLVRDLNIELDSSAATVLSQPATAKICTLKCSKSSGGRRRHTQSTTYKLSPEQCTIENQALTLARHIDQDNKCRYRAKFNYNVSVKKWQEDMDKDYTFPVNINTFQQTQIGDHFLIPAHPGALGLEWVDTDEIKRK